MLTKFDVCQVTRMAREDPELFATYHSIGMASRTVVTAHVDAPAAPIAKIISDGVASGEFAVDDPATAARAVLTATARSHNPVHASTWDAPGLDEEFDVVWNLILTGLAART